MGCTTGLAAEFTDLVGRGRQFLTDCRLAIKAEALSIPADAKLKQRRGRSAWLIRYSPPASPHSAPCYKS